MSDMTLARRLEDARNELRRLEAQALTASCAQLGCDMKSIGGCNCDCHEDACCSVPVHQCSRCKACDYGENDEAAETRRQCLLRNS